MNKNITLLTYKQIMNIDPAYEIWRTIPGYDGHYQVSTHGRVRSLSRWVRDNYDTHYLKKGRILKQEIQRDGYSHINLSYTDLSGNRHHKWYRVNRLVAMVFIPNPSHKLVVNHINEDKLDNDVHNLNWLTCKENIHWGTAIARIRAHSPYNKPVRLTDGAGYSTYYQSGAEASRAIKEVRGLTSEVCSIRNRLNQASKSPRYRAYGYQVNFVGLSEYQGVKNATRDYMAELV